MYKFNNLFHISLYIIVWQVRCRPNQILLGSLSMEEVIRKQDRLVAGWHELTVGQVNHSTFGLPFIVSCKPRSSRIVHMEFSIIRILLEPPGNEPKALLQKKKKKMVDEMDKKQPSVNTDLPSQVITYDKFYNISNVIKVGYVMD